MAKNKQLLILIFLILLTGYWTVQAQTTFNKASIKILGEVETVSTVTSAELDKMEKVP